MRRLSDRIRRLERVVTPEPVLIIVSSVDAKTGEVAEERRIVLRNPDWGRTPLRKQHHHFRWNSPITSSGDRLR
jgi:hypothetical protein